MSLRNPFVETKYLIKLIKLINLIIKSKKIFITGTGVCFLDFENFFIKIPLGSASNNALINEYNNYILLQTSPLKEYVSYYLKKINNYYKIEKLYKCKQIDLDKLVKDIENCKINKPQKQNLLRFDTLNNWCKCKFNYSYNYKSVCMHGDLTPKNIMCLDSKMQLIDLDRFCFNGIKGFDKLHFIIESESKEQKMSFFEWIVNNLNNFKKKELLLIYFVYRVNIESRHDKLSKKYKVESCKTYKKLIYEIRKKR